MKKLYFGSMLILVLFASSCSTIKNGTRQSVDISTTPPGLKAQIQLKECITPCTLTEVSRDSKTVTIYKDDQQFQYELEKSFNGWAVLGGNLCHPALVLIDFVAGSTHTIEPVVIVFE